VNRACGNRKYFVFRDVGSLDRAVKQLPFGFISGETVFLYSSQGLTKGRERIGVPFKPVAPGKNGRLSKLLVYLRMIASTRGRNKVIITDDGFEKRFLPPALKKALFVYPRSGTFIDTGSKKLTNPHT